MINTPRIHPKLGTHMPSLSRSLAQALAAAACLIAPPGVVFGQTFSNTGVITIPASGAEERATPYPSVISVSGVAQPIEYVTVSLNSFSHTYFSDARVLLVAPGGQSVILLSGVGGTLSVPATTIRFSPDGVPLTGLPNPSLWYAPSGLNTFPFSSPAPASGYSTNLNTLNGTSANGTWALYVLDSVPSVDGGALAGGWSITFNSPDRVAKPRTSAFTYQGKLSGGPNTGTINLRAALYNHPTAIGPANTLVTNVLVPGVAVENGLFTASLDFGSALQAPTELWLELEINVPPSGTFTKLARQQLTATPMASSIRGLTVGSNGNVGLGSVTSPQFALDVPGRVQVRGEAGATSNSPGIWLASPNPAGVSTFRSFMGQRNDDLAGFYSGIGWRFLVHTNGNVLIGDSTVAPPAKLTIQGAAGTDGIQFPDSTLQTTAFPGRIKSAPAVDFGPIGPGVTAAASLSVPGAAVGDAVVINPRTALPIGISITSCHVSTAGSVGLYIRNNSAGSIDPPANTFDVTVFK